MSKPIDQTHDIGGVFRLVFWQNNFYLHEYQRRFNIQQKKQKEMSKNTGRIVETKSGKVGRTFNSQDLVNGKVPVYLQQGEGYSQTAMLCDNATLRYIGFID